MPEQDDTPSKLAALQADLEQLRRELEEQKDAQAGMAAKMAALSDDISQARSEAEVLGVKVSELRISSDRSCALLKTIEPEKIASEISRLSGAVANLRDSIRRHEAEGKQIV